MTPGPSSCVSGCRGNRPRSFSRALSAASGWGAAAVLTLGLVLSAELMNYTGGLMSFPFEEPSTAIHLSMPRPLTTGHLKCAAVVI